MKITETRLKTIKEEVLLFIKCDKCGVEYSDQFEIQEFLHLNFIGGYGSVFGDMLEVESDICQHCLKKWLGEDYRKNNIIGF